MVASKRNYGNSLFLQLIHEENDFVASTKRFVSKPELLR